MLMCVKSACRSLEITFWVHRDTQTVWRAFREAVRITSHGEWH